MKPLEMLVRTTLVAAPLVGCTAGLSSLTDEEHATVALALDYGQIEESFVIELSTAADSTMLFDAEGNTGASAFQTAVSASSSLLATYFAEDRIVAFDPTGMESKDHVDGFHRDPLIGESFIALNLNLLEEGYVSPSILYHEAGHEFYGPHTQEVQATVDSLSSDDSPPPEDILYSAYFAEENIAAKDFPNLLSFFYRTGDTCFGNPEDYIVRVILNQEGTIQDGTKTPQEAYDDLTLLLLEPEKEWVDELTITQYSELSYLPSFDISKQEFHTALMTSTLYESQNEIYKEAIDLFVDSYPDEEITTMEEAGR